MECGFVRRLSLTGMAAAMATLGAASTAAAQVQPNAGMLRYPDVSKTQIVFSYANDLWVVSRDGGMARPLTSPDGAEAFPRFSADGKTIAFMGNYDGNMDLYTIPAAGGAAARVTHHPTGEILCDWTPSGDLLFYAGGITGNPQVSQLFTVDTDGGLPEQIPVPYGANGAISADGTWLAYNPTARDARTWKRYRGGMANEIWMFNLNDQSSRRVTTWEGTDSFPMWHRDKIYYLSDEGDSARLNIWVYDTGSGDHSQVTRFSQYDVKYPSIGPGGNGGGEIVFQNGTELYLLDLRSNQTRTVEVTIPGDRPAVRDRRIDVVQYIQAGDISSTGQRVAAEARGDIWTAPVENGRPRNLTRTSGVAERMPAWSPDGRWIAYFSDETGEYELYVTQSDGKGETRQLTDDGQHYRFSPNWSPDSKYILFSDKTASMYLVNVETGEKTFVDNDPRNPAGDNVAVWAPDSLWIAYPRGSETATLSSIWIYNVESGEKRQVTSDMFHDSAPAFSRDGDYLYFASGRDFNSPAYGNHVADTTFAYQDIQVLVAVPLRSDVENPYKLESDEEEWDDEEESSDDENAEGDEGDDEGDADAEPVSPIHGVWTGTISGLSSMGAPPEMDSVDVVMTIYVAEDGSITGSSEVMGESSDFDSVTFDEATGAFEARSEDEGINSVIKGKLDGDTMSGTWEIIEMGGGGTWTATRTSSEVDEDEKPSGDGDDDVEPIEIEFEGFEHRAFQLGVAPGIFGNLAVNDKNQLLYIRANGGIPSIKLFDLKDDTRSEKTVAGGAGGFTLSADGKKLVYQGAGGFAVKSSTAGGAGKTPVTDGMIAVVNPREEWNQLFLESWRLYRDFFYVENLHGVDWDAMRDLYQPMVDECVSRDDLNYVIGELISELNVGHAYRFGGDTDSAPSRNVGLLGIDWEIANGAYRVKSIAQGGIWDLDARNPLTAQEIQVNEGDYILAVNGLPLSTDMNPWSAFIDLAGQPVTLTVSDSPEMNDEARDVMIRAMGNESNLRYRGWIESNRAYVESQTNGEVGYIYVPNTGVNGQNDLFRQFYGQMDKKALIIDERWNGGGQIPTRFIELLNRPRTNYWATRDSIDWAWPPDSHQGPKCMLINGRAGSGGDMFPALFRQAGLGPIIGTRTWGGLVGISGNPTLIDGGYCAVPTFGYYEKDGTWGIEGHGVDPDVEVIDDPALMVDGGDPQLDVAIQMMLDAIKSQGYAPAQRPADPDRSGMGIAEEDK